jgi:ubiquinone/menaquinone biosynthesis C-methylase UbiE
MTLDAIGFATLSRYLAADAQIDRDRDELPTCKIPYWSPGMLANASFFGDPQFGKSYFELENNSQAFGDRWRSAIGNWDGKIVVDIGCGPGNLYAAVGGSPQMIVGVDISRGALIHAKQYGYSPLLADAHHLPFVNGFADIVTLNAALHHCDDMARVLAQAARLVRPGGLLISDEDPVAQTQTHEGLAWLIIAARDRFPMYWLPGRGKVYKSPTEQALRLATEIHNSKPGDGVTPALYADTLEPLGFTIELYTHYHNVGDELFRGEQGKLGFKDTLIEILCGDRAPQPPQSLMCIARKGVEGRV